MDPALICVFFLAFCAASTIAFSPPKSNCYALDNDYRLHDFTEWINYEFKHHIEAGDVVVRFCKDVQLRGHKGYTNYGRFEPVFFSASDKSHFHQQYNQGDLQGCEHNAYDLTGRDSEVSIICGSCNGSSSCTDKFGCICNATTDPTNCRTDIVLAVKCVQAGPRVLKGFTVGFTPRGKEIVDNGITQWGYDKFHEDYSFATEQRDASLYFTAPTSLSKLVKKPSFTVKPSKGLNVKLSGSAANGEPPTTESPTVLGVEWQCEKSTGGPYLVTVSVPAEGFDPIVFNLGKECEHKQKYSKGGSSGWATFGVICLVILILVSCCCCVGYCYNTRVEHKYGLEAVPGAMTFARYFDSASGQARSDGYRPAEDVSNSDGAARSSARPRTADSSKYGTV